ncbi:MAG: Na+/H+ antiporter NhaA [Planctomycetota bacterium]|jgi:NhaA family Na+:H+ antiporter
MALDAIRRFVRLEAAGGITLMAAAALALILANLPFFGPLYEQLLELPMEVRLGPLELKKTLLLVINDGLMAVFFLLVGLEIKREVLEGELSSFNQLALPGFAAIGGVAVPALIYALLNRDDPMALRGWAIPSATDIAFALGVLSLLGSRVPLALKVLLTAIAVIDDLAAIVIIAVFYTEELAMSSLTLAGVGFVVLIVMNRLKVTRLAPYFIVGTIMWICVLKSGIHATLDGVALALMIPLGVKDASGRSPLRHLEHILHPWVAWGILPLFAFANAGVSFAGVTVSDLWASVPLGIALGLIVGKTVGVFGFSAAAVGLGIARRPPGVSWGGLLGTSMLCGIGFTMSLFIGLLAFKPQGSEDISGVYGVHTRIGVIGGSLVSAVAGLLVLTLALPRTGQAGADRDDGDDGAQEPLTASVIQPPPSTISPS